MDQRKTLRQPREHERLIGLARQQKCKDDWNPATMIGKLTRLPLRKVWKHEALDFTTWLEKNVDVLNDALDL